MATNSTSVLVGWQPWKKLRLNLKTIRQKNSSLHMFIHVAWLLVH